MRLYNDFFTSFSLWWIIQHSQVLVFYEEILLSLTYFGIQRFYFRKHVIQITLFPGQVLCVFIVNTILFTVSLYVRYDYSNELSHFWSHEHSSFSWYDITSSTQPWRIFSSSFFFTDVLSLVHTSIRIRSNLHGRQ